MRPENSAATCGAWEIFGPHAPPRYHRILRQDSADNGKGQKKDGAHVPGNKVEQTVLFEEYHHSAAF